jgi:hypothetical protein
MVAATAIIVDDFDDKLCEFGARDVRTYKNVDLERCVTVYEVMEAIEDDVVVYRSRNVR